MFRCERCGSRYSARHAVAIEHCPRCRARDRISSPLAFKAFRLPERTDLASARAQAPSAR
jgi:hypothetical protein